MSPTIYRYKSYRFFFFSREEERVHIHVMHPDGEAKIWIEPEIEMHSSYGLSPVEINEIIKFVKEHRDEITERWYRHFRQ